ncbi:hypothetical protein AB4Y36_19460 [Paraburkholderia sp. BR10936]|uniref:hypothetical protein n=1 Tax=Paraburkholderia sp. BR10936 TaxID=3236993 RepID=UPI0034D1CA08
MKKLLGKIVDSRLVVGGIILVFAAAAIVGSNYGSQWWQGLLQNIGAGFATSLVLIAFYDQIVERRAQADVDARRRVAMRRLAHAVRKHVRGVLFSMYRSSIEAQPPGGVGSFREFVERHFAGPIPHLNILAPSDAGFPTSPLYAEWIAQTFRIFSASLESWIATYANCATSEVVGWAEDLLDSDFLTVGGQLDRVLSAMRLAQFIPPAMSCFNAEMTGVYGAKLAKLIVAIEAATGESVGTLDASAWHNQFYQIGHARVQHQVPA